MIPTLSIQVVSITAIFLVSAVAPVCAFAIKPLSLQSTVVKNSSPFVQKSSLYSIGPLSTPPLPPPSSVVAQQEKYNNDGITIRNYQHKDKWKLTYLYKAPSPGNEKKPPIIFVHPIGIGLSSWFWTKVMSEFGTENSDDDSGGSPPMYAVDLIGCGLEHGSQPWDPDQEGLFIPLSWVEGIETLINDVIRSECNIGDGFLQDLFGNKQNDNGCTVIVQGGLAKVGIQLAARNPTTVSKLILTSPPVYKDIVTPIPEEELDRNYNFLRSKILGGLAFALLESRSLIRFFSDLFLFKDKCDEDWLEFAMNGISDEARTPVQVFNAGLIDSRGFGEEVSRIEQPVLVVSGDGDKRKTDRVDYATELNNCRLIELEGANVLPWENPCDTVKMIKEFMNNK